MTPSHGILLSRVVIAIMVAVFIGHSCIVAAADPISESAQTEIAALIAEKNGRTPAQRKMDSQLVYFLKQKQNAVSLEAVPNLETAVEADENDRVLVDVGGTITDKMRNF